MLEDFIKANELEAKILPYVSEGKKIKCKLFSSESGNFLAVFFSTDKLSQEKLEFTVGVQNLKPVAFALVEDETGYLPEFLPPISVYGVKIVVDEMVSVAPKLRCVVGEEKVLEIVPKEIIETNEDSIVADITE